MTIVTVTMKNEEHNVFISILKKGNSSSLEDERGVAKSCAFANQKKLLLARVRDTIVPQLL